MQQLKALDKNIWVVYGATLSVGSAGGLALSVLALHLHRHGFSEEDIGTLAGFFALGVALFALPVGALIRRFSAKAVLCCSLLIYGAAVIAFPFSTHSIWWASLLRVFDGAASAGIWVGCETVILARSQGSRKAQVTSLYAAAIALGYMCGPLLSRIVVAFHSMDAAFFTAGLISLATALALFVLLGGESDQQLTPSGEGSELSDVPASQIRSRSVVLRRIKTSCFGNFAYGYFQSSVVLFLPLYLMASKEITRDQTIIIPAFFAAGMLLCVTPLGRLGDRVGPLRLMRGLGVVGILTILGFIVLNDYVAMCVAVFVAGATLASISPLSLALQGTILRAGELSRGNALYNGFYAMGMLVGPPIAGRIFHHWGGPMMLYHLAALWTAFVLFAYFYRNDDPARLRSRQPDLQDAQDVAMSSELVRTEKRDAAA
ncbi:MAG: MFS transporter [Polyangiaceae bacterium]|nr:MFS transporter [Polyangiaceae bacterium]